MRNILQAWSTSTILSLTSISTQDFINIKSIFRSGMGICKFQMRSWSEGNTLLVWVKDVGYDTQQAHLSLFGSFYEMSFNEEKKQVIHCILRHSAPHKPHCQAPERECDFRSCIVYKWLLLDNLGSKFILLLKLYWSESGNWFSSPK